jgi:CRISPR system Cascade subunit CasB
MTKEPFAEEAGEARKWWSRLQPQVRNGHSLPGDRGAIARLRRASNILEAAIEPATADLYARLGLSFPERDLPRAALIAAVLAHVRDDTTEPVAIAIGTPRGGADTTTLLTPLRLRRLIAAREVGDLLIAFRRVIAILREATNVRDLARVLLAWTDPVHNRAEIARTRFAFDFHRAGQYAPETASETETLAN